MKLELEISDELWKRIQDRASLFNTAPPEFVRRLLEQHVPNVHDPKAALALLRDIAAGKYAGPDDDYDIDEFLEALERNRGQRPVAPERNGEPSP
jgi:hypothetical protein